jgi:tRNA(fMet)-specific endonuclease VapC
MVLFDTDALTEILAGDADFLARLATVPVAERATTIITVEEILRGRLADVRQAETHGKPPLLWTYERLWSVFTDLRRLPILPYDDAAHAHYEALRPSLKGKVGVHDLRVAAIALSVGGTVVTRNRRDFRQIPGLAVEFWL